MEEMERKISRDTSWTFKVKVHQCLFDSSIHHFLCAVGSKEEDPGGHKTIETVICEDAHRQVTMLLGECPLDRNWSCLATHFSFLFTNRKLSLQGKEHCMYLLWSMGGCFATQGMGQRCRAQWILKTFNTFWSETYYPVSKSSVSVLGHGFSNMIMTKNTRLKSPKNHKE